MSEKSYQENIGKTFVFGLILCVVLYAIGHFLIGS